MNFYERHIGDYLKDTAHLSLLEHGVYTRLLDIYYTRETGIPEKEAARLIGARSRDERDALASVLGEFFQLVDGVYHQDRAEREIERLHDKRRKASASATARWAQSDRNAIASDPHMPTESDRTADAMRTHSEGNARAPVPSPQSPVPIEKKPPSEVAGNPENRGSQPASPPAFDGTNTEALNGKHVVALAPRWELPEPWGVDAEALGWKPAEVLLEAEKFRQYWTAGKGSGTRRSVKGWRQTWSTWLGKAARDKR